jgi:hypothetical protein
MLLPGWVSAVNQKQDLTSHKIHKKNTLEVLFLANHLYFSLTLRDLDLVIYLTKGSNSNNVVKKTFE